MTKAAKTLAELAQHVGGRVIGDAEVSIHKVAAIDEAGPGEITFLANPRYRQFLTQCKASAIVVGPGVIADTPAETGKGYLETASPYIAFAKILQLFSAPIHYSHQISSLAQVDPTAILDEEVTIFPQAFVSRGVKIGKRTVLYPGVFLGEDCRVGDGCVLYPNVVVREGCRIGNRVILQPGVVIGSDGFGYAGRARIGSRFRRSERWKLKTTLKSAQTQRWTGRHWGARLSVVVQRLTISCRLPTT